MKPYEHNVILETNLQVKKTTVERKFLLDQFRKCTPFIFKSLTKMSCTHAILRRRRINTAEMFFSTEAYEQRHAVRQAGD